MTKPLSWSVCLLILATSGVWGHIDHQPGAATCSSHPCTLAVTCPTYICAATDIQTAINEAVGGDTISVQAGVVWTSTGNITLKSGMTSTVTIRTSTDDSSVPASNTRITPAYSALLPNIQLTSSASPLFRVEQSTSRTKNYSYLGIQFSSAQNIDSSYALFDTWYVSQGPGIAFTDASNTSPIRLTMASTSGLSNGNHVIVQGLIGNTAANGWWTISNVTATTVDLNGSTGNGTFQKGPLVSAPVIYTNAIYDASQMPDSISFDRCLFIGAPLSGIRQGVRLAGSNLTVKNSYCDGIKAQNDSQCISMPSTPGPVTITNNFLGGGSGETVMAGGAVPNLAGPDGTGQNATDVTITHNAFYKDPALYKYESWAANTWVRQGKVIDGGNGFRYIAMSSGTTGQSAPALSTAAVTVTTDGTVTWQRNYFVNSAKWAVKNLLEFKNADRATVKWNSFDGSWADAQTGTPILINSGAQNYIGIAKSQHVEYGYNVVRHTPMFFSANSEQDYGDGILLDINLHDTLVIDQQPNTDTSNPTFQFSARFSAPPNLTQLQVVHNTVDRSNVSTFLKFVNGYAGGAGKFDAPVFRDNLFNMSGAAYPVWCSTCPLAGAKNVFDGITNGLGAYLFVKIVVAGQNLGTYPTGNYNSAWASIGFTDPTNRDFSLASSSPYKNAGTDSKDLGADTTQLPQIRNLAIAASNTQATLSWNVTAPVQSIPCVAEVATDASFSVYVPDQDPTHYTRPDVASGTGLLSRTITIGAHVALSPNTTYAYRLHCGGAFEYGQFTTAAASLQSAVAGTASVVGGNQGNISVYLSGPAPAGGKAISITSSQPALASIASPVIPAGKTSMTVTFSTQPVSSTSTATITVADAALSIPVGVTILPASLRSAVVSGTALRFLPITPCRIADTRYAAGPFGGPAIAGGTSRDFNIPASACGVPVTAQAYSLNVAVVPSGPLSFLTVWPAGQTRPLASTLNSDGRIKSNAAIVPAGTAGAISVYASQNTQVILDINGYFVPATDPTALAFYSITPCRIADTRNPTAPLGGPSLIVGQTRSFPILSSTCNLPTTAKAYSLNFAVVPRGPLFLTAWPTGQTMPLASSLNAGTGTVTANAAIVPAGTNGSVDVYVNGNTDLVIDINGYFAPMTAGGLSLYGVTPCRVLDTRQPAGSAAIGSELDVGVAASACGIPITAQAHVLSVTVVPQGILGFLTLWQQGPPQPLAATLNAQDAAITSNLAIVPTTNGWICAFPSSPTHIVMDIAGYFGQ